MKKFLAMLLCAAMAVSAMAGCSPKEEEKESSETPSTVKTESKEAEPEKLKIELPYKGEEVHFSAYGPEGVKQYPDTPVAKAWREHVGNIFIDWELAPSADYKDKVKVYLASGNMPDVLPILDFKVTINQYGDSGMFLDFAKYEEYMPNMQAYRAGKEGPFMDSILNAKGERLAIMGIQPTDYAGEGWQANQTMLTKMGIKVPNTFDEFMQAMKDVKAKDPKVIPFQTYWGLNYTKGWFSDAVGARKELVYYDAADKTWKLTYREPTAKRKELIEALATAYKEGLINPEIATMSGEQEDAALKSANWAFYAGYNSSVRGYFKADIADGSNPMPIELTPMLPPTASDGKRHLGIAYIHDAIPGWGFVASSKAKQPEYLAAYMDAVVSPFGKDNWNLGVEGVTYDMVDGKPVMKTEIDREKTGFYSQYEVWTVGMGAEERVLATDDQYYKDIHNMNVKAFGSGEMLATYTQGIPIFMPEAGATRSSMENDLKTFIEENEAKFIYGNRKMTEWDAYVAEMEKYVKIDDLLKLYAEAKTIDISGPRIWQPEVK